MEQLGLPHGRARSLIMRPRGLFLVTGPTGSGKTTTLASMVNYINENFDHHIITIEDPIEFYHNHKKSTINQREVGVDVPSFSEAIRRALRQDPDVILVGEMRDLATIEAAITAAETGHIVFGTLHTTGAPGHGQPHHRRVSRPTSRTRFARSFRRRSSACCRQRCCPRSAAAACAAYEMLVVTPAIANLIRENKTFRINSAIQTGRQARHAAAGRRTCSSCGRKRSVTKEDVLAKANNRRRAGRAHRQRRARPVR